MSVSKIGISSILPVEENDIERINEQPDPTLPNLNHLSDTQHEQISSLLKSYSSAISQNESDIGYCDILQHPIDTGNHQPIATRQWPLPHSTKQVMKEQCEKMLEMNVIEPCSSPWRSPSLLVKKKDSSHRYCIDFRNINNVTKKDNFPLPRIDTVLQSLGGSSCFTSLDLKSGYWQIPILEKDRDKTSFSTDSGTYRFCRMPFGLCNAPATFQRLMQVILEPVLNKFAMVYLDDIIIYSPNFDTHLTHIAEVLFLIQKSGLKISLSKCNFAKDKLKYLGHIVSTNGIQVDTAKTEAIEQMKEPRTCRQVRSFIGMASYYRKFISNFSAICAPLTELTKKSVRFSWTDKHQESFKNIKHALINPPILKYPDYNKSFRIHTDASNEAVGAMLSQVYDDIDMPVAYYSRKLNSPERNYSTTEKEALAIVAAVKHFSTYVFGYKFTILTDHSPLRYIFQYKATVPRITRWAMLLAEFDYEIVYKSGKEHVIPDLLSRNVCRVEANEAPPFDPASIFDETKVRNEQEKDSGILSIINGLESNDSTLPYLDNYVLQNKCLYLMRTKDPQENDSVRLRLVVPPSLKKEALILSHNSTLGGHYGVKKTLYRCRQMFYWPNQCSDVQKHIAHCEICQKRNFNGMTRAQIRQLPVVDYPLQRVGVDLIGKISSSYSGNCFILTIVCHFSRFVQAYALPNKQTETICRAFLDYVCRYGCPEHIVSDRGSEFISSTFREILSQLKAKLHLTTAYHPQSNGMTEAFNKLLKNTLHAMVQSDYMTWDEQLPCAVLALNCSYHPAVRNTPYFLFHGRDPPLKYSTLLDKNVLNYGLDADTSTSVFARLQKAFKEAREASQDAHDVNKKYRRTKEIYYNLGDAVFLKNDSKSRGPFSKFQNRWIGPYRITKILSDVNYEIIQIHGQNKTQKVHADRLKPAKLHEEQPYIYEPETHAEEVNKRLESECTNNPESDSSDEDEVILRRCRRRNPANNQTINNQEQSPPRSSEGRYALRSKGPAPELVLPARQRRRGGNVLMVCFIAIIYIFVYMFY